jgi:FkbM family methyltransferase
VAENSIKTSLTQELRTQTLAVFSPVVGPFDRGRTARSYRGQSAGIVDELFRHSCRAAKIENLLECGAHEASASIDFIKSGGARAIAIEANPQVLERKTNRATKSGVEVLNFGLAEKKGKMDFFLPKGRAVAGSSSFRTKSDDVDVIEVTTTTIDALHKDLSIIGTLALWVDVEGYAFEVLKGASKTLARPELQILKVEMEDAERWRGQRTLADLAPQIEKFGFIPVLSDLEYVNQFNVIYVRPEILEKFRTDISDAVSKLHDVIHQEIEK